MPEIPGTVQRRDSARETLTRATTLPCPQMGKLAEFGPEPSPPIDREQIDERVSLAAQAFEKLTGDHQIARRRLAVT